jgi:hypothetical protein
MKNLTEQARNAPMPKDIVSNKGSISPTFYARLFCMKVLPEAFLQLHFRFELFMAQEY